MLKYIDAQTDEELTQAAVRERANRQLGIIVPVHQLNDAELLETLGVDVVDYIETPVPEVEQWQTVTAGPLDKTTVAGEWRTTWVVNTSTVADAVDKKLSEMAAARWLHQVGGINVGGINIDSGDSTALYVDTALKKMESNPTLVLNWKGADGTFHQLNQAALQAVADALFAHVQNAFAAEGSLVEAVAGIANDEQLTDEQKLQQIAAVQWVPFS